MPEPKAVNMKSKLAELMAAVEPTIKSGDENAVKVLRDRIEMVRKSIFEVTNHFDAILRNAQSGMDGSDYLAAIETFRKLSDKVGRPRKVKPEVAEEVTNW